MEWKTLLAYITGSVDQELLLRNEYLVTENRMLRQQIPGRVRLTDAERTTLAQIGKQLGRKALEEVASIVTPDTILAWHRTLVAQKFDGSQQRKAAGRPTIDEELEALVVRLARDNRSWGYDRIAGALHHLGYAISDQTVGNILKRHSILPAPERKKTTTWKECIRTHREMLVATDFLTAEVWTTAGLGTYSVLFFIHLSSRKVHVAGMTTSPDEHWMVQIARHVTMADWGVLAPGQYLIHDRDGKYCPAFQHIIDAAGVTRVPLPPRSPHLHAYAERWVRSVKEECLAQMILCGERALQRALTEYVGHYHAERPHQGKGNVVLISVVDTPDDVLALCAVGSGSVGCSNTITATRHKRGDPTVRFGVVWTRNMIAAPIFVFDSSPLVASCQFSVGSVSVAALVTAGMQVWIPPAVYDEVITRGGTRPDALEAARLVQVGQIHLADATRMGEELADLQYYHLGQGEREALTLTAHVAEDAVFVTDDFLALVVAHRLGLPSTLLLDFVIGRARRGELRVAEAQRIVQAVSTRYPQGFVPHSLALLGRLTP